MANIKKRTLINFLHDTESQLVSEVVKDYEVLYKRRKQEILINVGIDGLLTKAQDNIIEVCKINENIVSKLPKGVTFTGYYDNPIGQVNRLGGTSYITKMLHEIDCAEDSEILKLKKVKDGRIQEIRTSYVNLRAICQNKRTGKEVQEYLEGLGFDLSSLKGEEQTSIVVPIDLNKLNIGLVNSLNSKEDNGDA